MRFTKVQLAALAFVAGVLPAAVSADGWFSRAGKTKEVTLTDLLKTPRDYMDVEVQFKVYFDATGRNFNPYFTRFNEDCYGNFSAWPIDARLYDKRDFPRPYPLFFASKMTKAWKKVKDVDHLRVIEITGVVRDVFKGQPWIEVLSWSASGGGLSQDDIRDVIHADADFVAGRYKDAARLYERADSSRLDDSVRADLQRRLGDAYFRAGEYGDARDAYETGLRCMPDNPVLKQGAEAAEAARQQERAARRGQPVSDEAPELAPAEQPVVESNGVDEVIRLFEDPAAVAADVTAWHHELEQRAAQLNAGTPEATPVAGSEAGEQPAVEPEATPAPAPEVVPEPAAEPEAVEPEGCTETAPEGCTEEPAGCAEQPAEQPTETAQPAETPKPVETAQPVEAPKPVETPAAGEQPEGTPEGVEGCSEGTSEESAPATGEGACGGATAPEGCGETLRNGCGEQAAGCSEVPDEPAVLHGDERVVWVSGQMIQLPRLPFFGAEDVTDDDLRAIIEDIVKNPETDE